MKNLGYIVVGMNAGIIFSSFLARHGQIYSLAENLAHFVCGLSVLLVLEIR